MSSSLTTLKLQAVATASLVLAQVASAALISETFQTDPFAAPNPRWSASNADVQWDATAENLKIGNCTVDMVSAATVFLPTTDQTAYLQYDFKPVGMSGSFAMTTAMRQSDGTGYGINPYIIGNLYGWFIDGAGVVLDSSTTCALSSGTWYTVRVDMINDTVNNQTLLTGSLLQGNTVLAGFVAHDSSAGRYTTHQGFKVSVYPGNGYGGIDVNPFLLDNIEAGAVPEPASFGLLAGLAALGLARRRAR
jgi:hypothetical protein